MTQSTALSPIDDLRNNLQKMESQFKLALPPQITPERFVRVVMTAIQTNPDLVKVERGSLFGACMKAAQDGLLPDGREAALVPYAGKAQYIPMIWGIAKKIRNSGELASLSTQMVHENDKFRFWVDDQGEHLTHDPEMFSDRGKPIGVYAIIVTKDDSPYIEVMNANQIAAVRAVSKAKSGPWTGPFEFEMWRKTVLRRLSKRVPMATDIEQVITRDDELYDVDAADSGTPSKGRQLENIINTTSEPVAEPEASIEAKVIKRPGAIAPEPEPDFGDLT